MPKFRKVTNESHISEKTAQMVVWHSNIFRIPCHINDLQKESGFIG